MSDPATPANPPAPKSRRRKWSFRFCVGLLLLAIATFLLWQLENWRGRKALEQAKARLAAKGINANWRDYIPRPVPREENFYAVWSFYRGRLGPTNLNWAMNHPPGHWGPIGFDYLKGAASYPPPTLFMEMGLPKEATEPTVIKLDDNELLSAIRALARLATLNVVIDSKVIGWYPDHRPSYPGRRPEAYFTAIAVPQTNTAPAALLDSILSEKGLAAYRQPDGVIKIAFKQYDAAALLVWFEQYKTGFDALEKAAARPKARLEGSYNDPMDLPTANYVAFRNQTQVCASRAEAHLLLGHKAEAQKDVLIMIRMAEAICGDTGAPTLVAAMIRVATAGIICDVVGEGMADNLWDMEQLQTISDRLGKVNYIADVELSLHGELAGCLKALKTLAQDRDALNSRTAFDLELSDLGEKILTLMPAGWVHQNAALYADLMRGSLEAFDVGKAWIDPVKAAASAVRIEQAISPNHPYAMLAGIMTPNFAKALPHYARNQAYVHELRLAVALQKYRQATGHYPDKLEALLPQFIPSLPVDPVTGKSFHYRLQGNGQPLLYSVGWDGTDNGGKPSKEKKEAAEPNTDWVWNYFPKSP